MNRIIGLAGGRRAGKDTAATFITEAFRGTVERDAFADRLKLIAARALDIKFHPDQVGAAAVRRWADHFKEDVEIIIRGPFGTVEDKVTGRRFLQRLGAEGIRDVLGPSTLVDALPLERDCDLLIVTDVRFDNEAKAILEAGGQIWEILRPGRPADNHVSEERLGPGLVQRVLLNSGTLDDLKNTIRNTLVLDGYCV